MKEQGGGGANATPSGARIYAHREGEPPVDITTGVQALYDLVISSMDWTSGFWTVEDALPVVHVAQICGFKDWGVAAEYVNCQQHSYEQERFLQEHKAVYESVSFGAHDHVWSSTGRCVWPGCYVTEEPV